MTLSLQEQRANLDEASRVLEGKIWEMQHQRQVLIDAFNSIDHNNENILESGSILAQEARNIMRKLTTNF
jgi:hypothetical protein